MQTDENKTMYAYYKNGWPVCTGTAEYVARMTGKTKGSILSSASRANEHRQTGAWRVEMEGDER